jgi:type IV pilus assembly protein PilM
MAKIQPVWSLDIGQAALKALKLVPSETSDTVTAEAFDYVEYPKILSQPDADPDQLVREALATFLERNELKGCKVAISVPGQAGLVKFIKLPPVEKKRIPDIVKFEAKQQIPFALEEVVWAYQQIGDDEEEGGEEDFTMAEVGLFAMKRDQINRAILPFRVAGIEVDIVQMGPIALYNFITFDQIKAPKIKPPKPEAAEGETEGEGGKGEKKEEKKEEPEDEKPEKWDKGSIVLLDIGADNTDLIITDGTRIWQRNVPIGGNHFTRALTKELKLTFAKAEHLKRNATKAPDPRSIFTAMRGVFNDFASEINRSIGFYSSVNRTAKIAKVVGLGNGFKLPGLQKFLQQNLSHEVEKLEGFQRMVGDDVKTAPQFQENLPSFAVAYGLGIQGLNRSGLRTNLLPPEIEQVRLIRAKKPWALAASALLMFGLSSLFLGDYRVLAKVDNEPFHQAVDQAKNVSSSGAGFKSQFEAAKAEWTTKFNEGKALIIDTADRGRWPAFLKTINAALPNPTAPPWKLDPNNPADQNKLDRLRVHIDAIKPVYRKDVKVDWFDTLPEPAKNAMHPYDRTVAPPSGEGWIVQLIGHHYNPQPNPQAPPDEQRTMFGPYPYLTKWIVPSLITPTLRLYGIKAVSLRWMSIDRNWTTEKGAATNGLTSTSIPILARATPTVKDTGTSGGMPSEMGRYAAQQQMMPGTMGGREGMDSSMMNSYAMMMGGMNAGMGLQGTKKNVKTLTRTDFLIQFIWQPPKPEEMPKTPEEMKTKVEEIVKLLTDAEKNQSAVVMVRESDLENLSRKQSQDLTNALNKQAGPAPTGAGVPGAGTPGAQGPQAVGVPSLPGVPK